DWSSDVCSSDLPFSSYSRKMRSSDCGFCSMSLKFRMKPSSLKILQISALSFDVGTSTRSCFARCALRILVRRSETGSMLLIPVSSPARLDHAREIALARQVPEADAAECELSDVAARAAAPAAAVAHAHLVLELLLGLGNLGRRRHLGFLAAFSSGRTACRARAGGAAPARRSTPW